MDRAKIIRNLLREDFNRLSYLTPEEQKKITDAIDSIDRLIAQQTQKLELLKQHRAGLTQKLVPTEGQMVPELRFPEFRTNDGAI